MTDQKSPRDDKGALVIGVKEMVYGVAMVFGSIAVLAGLRQVLSLDVPEYLLAGIGAAIGVAAWFLLLKSRRS